MSIVVDEIVDFIFREINEGKLFALNEKPVLDFLEKQKIILYEIYNWLSNNQVNSNSIFLFGYFNFFGIKTSKVLTGMKNLRNKDVKMLNLILLLRIKWIWN